MDKQQGPISVDEVRACLITQTLGRTMHGTRAADRPWSRMIMDEPKVSLAQPSLITIAMLALLSYVCRCDLWVRFKFFVGKGV
ncbi:hypothetical protein J6590_010773 [Homalodisca vitripennis]|nr:hypothetical protein J6590_010773 [Homalodisca vitripennis]